VFQFNLGQCERQLGRPYRFSYITLPCTDATTRLPCTEP
jgi:hypothetical protein